MATPIKKKDPVSIKKLIKRPANISRRIVIVVSGLILIFGIVFITFFTTIFKISKLAIVPRGALQCVSEQDLQKKLKNDSAYVWSHVFNDGTEIRNAFSCIDSIRLTWTPFDFHTLSAHISVKRPVMKVKVGKTSITDRKVRQEELIEGQIQSEELLYATSNGSLLTFAENMSVPEISYRTFADDAAKTISVELVTAVFQLKAYILKEFNSEPAIDITSGGMIRLSLPEIEKVYFTSRVSIGAQLNSLQAVLKQSTINKAKIELIDLRFGNPVVRFKK